MPGKKPSIRQRLGAAIAGTRSKDFIPSLAPLGGLFSGGQGRTNDYLSKEEQVKANVAWSYAANDSISSLCAAVELELFQKKEDGEREQIFNHPILDLLDGPNNAHTGEQLRKLHHSYVNFTGEGYLYMTTGAKPFKPGPKKLPDAIQVFESQKVQFKMDPKGSWSNSIVKFQNEQYPITAFIRDIDPDLENPYAGQSVIAKAAKTVNLDDEMKEWNRNLIANGAKPSLIFNSNEEMSDESYARFQQQFSDDHTGAENAGKPLLIEGGDAKPFTMSPSDLDFIGSRGFSRDEILAMWKTPLAVLGGTADFNRANMDAALAFHILFNVVPRVRQFVKQLNQSFIKQYDPSLVLDFKNPVPEDVQAKLASAVGGVNKWWTIDEVRAMYGDKPLPDHLGEQMIVPGLSVSLESVLNNEAPTPTNGNENAPADDPVDDPTNSDPKKKSQEGVKKKDLASSREARGDEKVTRYHQRADRYEGQIAFVLRKQFEAQRTQIITSINNWDRSKSYKSKDAASDKKRKRDLLAALIVWTAANVALEDEMRPILYALMVETGMDAVQQAGKQPSQFDPLDPKIVASARDQANKAAVSINQETEKQLRAELGQGIDADEPIGELLARVEKVMGSALTMRTARITSTESYRAMGNADVLAWLQLGTVTGKEWYTAKDERVCPFCNAMDGTIIALDIPFFKEGDSFEAASRILNIAYDNVDAPPLHVSCRCVALDVDLA